MFFIVGIAFVLFFVKENKADSKLPAAEEVLSLQDIKGEVSKSFRTVESSIDSLSLAAFLPKKEEAPANSVAAKRRKTRKNVNFDPVEKGYVASRNLNFTLKEEVVTNNVLLIEGQNFNNDKTTALIIDDEGNIQAWYNSNELRVNNKRIQLNIASISPGRYTIRFMADGTQFSRSFTKI